ncbi:hypothetical protein OX284_005770 [Flavobacterium sp. SUN046]|jgi:hypothetical protein|uniref:hypothetical protein n=1 Tax=Flavobacterium sp. SUN046 TaxID=3002440 RepID=UPI002DBF9303|nr:hypothetical protein [Flavobacterium sp. SUN046]MEC4048926.1 hypothetical protein [Flavobacterium sp. SUN046]
MFVESAFIIKEFREEQIPILENVTSLCIVNKGSSIAQINGVLIYPTQKQILVVPDGTYSKVQLEVNYIETNNSIKGYTPKNKILLIYKKLI